MRSFPANPYDGHTLEQVEILTDQSPDLAVVDRGYRGHDALKTRVLISGTRRGLTPKLIADLRRRIAIEAEIGHMKTDGRDPRSKAQSATPSSPHFAATTFERSWHPSGLFWT